jgi:hypothetical protein
VKRFFARAAFYMGIVPSKEILAAAQRTSSVLLGAAVNVCGWCRALEFYKRVVPAVIPAVENR